MKKNAFTLTELLAVIIILGLIAIIIIPSFIDTLNRSKERLNDTQKEQIIKAARTWGMENLTLNNGNLNKTTVTIETLQNTGFLEDKEIKNLIDKENLNKDTIICIRYKNNQYEYTYEGDKLGDGNICTK